jgi:ribonuclease HI
MTKLLLQCDGGSRGNPGPAAYGFVVYDITNTSAAAIILEKRGNYLGETTNNYAEYQGLIAGLTWVTTLHPSAELTIKMDSLLIVNQIKGEYKVKHPDLKPLYLRALTLLQKLPGYTIEHTYRENNSLADQLVNDALDSQI